MFNFDLPPHSYEEIRTLTIDALLARQMGQFNDLLEHICRTILQKHNRSLPPTMMGIAYPGAGAILHPEDTPLVLEVFWDLFRQGAVTLGFDANHPGWPAYRLTRFAQHVAQQTPLRFHDTTAYIALVKTYVPDLLSEAEAYLEEAVAAFYADCLFASCVMLGVAAEAEFLRLVEVACASATHGAKFSSVAKPLFIRQKIAKFLPALRPLIPSLPNGSTEDIDTNFSMIQSILRIARNDAGHPTAASPKREQVYVNLQLFPPFARQLMRLRAALA